MRKLSIVAALAAAAITLGLMAAPVSAQTVSDAASYALVEEEQEGARLVAPGEDPVAIFERAETTAFTPDGEVELPYGDLAAEIIMTLLSLAGLAAAWLLRRLPSSLVSAFDMIAGAMGQGRANELLEKAITYGINTTAGAVKGKTLTVKVGNEVLERAFEYAVRHAPALVAKLGGITVLREKIIARLELDADAAIPSPRPPAEQLIQQVAASGAVPPA